MKEAKVKITPLIIRIGAMIIIKLAFFIHFITELAYKSKQLFKLQNDNKN